MPIGTNYQRPHFENLLNTVFHLLRNSQCKSYPEINPKIPSIENEKDLVPLNHFEKKCLYSFSFWQKLFEIKYMDNRFDHKFFINLGNII